MMLDQTLLREATFELLASSTSRRYIREAKRLARDAKLTHAVQNDPAMRAAVEERAGELLEQLRHETERTPSEFEAAVLLCALARAGSVNALQRATTSSSTWIRGLASWNPGEPANQSVELTPGGNRVRSYLDIVAPDETPTSEILGAVQHFVAAMREQPLPWGLTVGRCTIRFGLELGLEQHWAEEFRRLVEAAMQVRVAA